MNIPILCRFCPKHYNEELQDQSNGISIFVCKEHIEHGKKAMSNYNTTSKEFRKFSYE